MKKLISIILISISLHAFSQEFAPLGAKWHYDLAFNTGLITYQTIESLSDTVINGKPCRKLINFAIVSGVPETTYLYMYSVNDSVFWYNNGDFHLLYYFGALPGDTITLGYFTTYNGSPLKMLIDSTSTININGQIRTLQYVSCGDNIFIEFGGIIISGIGNLNWIFPITDMQADGPLRCYSDSLVGLFLNPFHYNNGWNFQDCEQQIITEIEENSKLPTVDVYPIPSNSLIFISNLDRNTKYLLYDYQGRVINKGIVAPSEPIQIKSYPNGIYSIILINNKIKAISRRVMKI